jgi:hypothetical protein
MMALRHGGKGTLAVELHRDTLTTRPGLLDADDDRLGHRSRIDDHRVTEDGDADGLSSVERARRRDLNQRAPDRYVTGPRERKTSPHRQTVTHKTCRTEHRQARVSAAVESEGVCSGRCMRLHGTWVIGGCGARV